MLPVKTGLLDPKVVPPLVLPMVVAPFVAPVVVEPLRAATGVPSELKACSTWLLKPAAVLPLAAPVAELD